MKEGRKWVAVLLPVLLLAGTEGTCADGWYAGKWDSTIYNRSEKPRTVGVRIQVLDFETDLPIPGVEVALRGEWVQERIGTSADEVGSPYAPQEREFRLTAETPQDGVVVFALGWVKEYPWFFGRPKPKVDNRGNVTFWDVHTSWTRAVDDIEKVQFLETHHTRYLHERMQFSFSHLLEFGQNRRREGQTQAVIDSFDRAWQQEMRRPEIRFCVLDLGTDFTGFQNKQSTRGEFFEKMRRKDYGTVYTSPQNWFSAGEQPQSECGPYFIYEIQIPLQPRSRQLDVYLRQKPDGGQHESETRDDQGGPEDLLEGNGQPHATVAGFYVFLEKPDNGEFVVLNPDGTFHLHLGRETESGVTWRDHTGAYSVDGDDLTLVDTDRMQDTATLSGDVLTLHGNKSKWRKRE